MSPRIAPLAALLLAIAASGAISACGSGGADSRPTATVPGGAPGRQPAAAPPANPTPAPSPAPAVGPLTAARSGATVTIAPLGLVFDLPERWLTWYESSHNNIHLTGPELAAVRAGGGEWDTEYAAVVNAALDFDRCVLHAGGEGWGDQAVAWSDVQMRVYVLDETPEALTARFRSRGTEAFAATARTPPRSAEDPSGAWQRSALTAMLMFRDYGGEATVDLRVRRLQGWTIAFVFMYSNYEAQEPVVQAILGSVRPP